MIGKNAIAEGESPRTMLALRTDDGREITAKGWDGLAAAIRTEFGDTATMRFAVDDTAYCKNFIIDSTTDTVIVGVTYVTPARALNR